MVHELFLDVDGNRKEETRLRNNSAVFAPSSRDPSAFPRGGLICLISPEVDSSLRVVAVSKAASCAFLPDFAAVAQQRESLKALAGQHPVEGFATVYTGFQFGAFGGQLGDGRCITLVEGRVAKTCDRVPLKRKRLNNASIASPFNLFTDTDPLFELQVKGGSRTPFSRRFDGLYTRGTAVREFVLAEVLALWGLPTSRCVALSFSDRMAQRDGVFMPQKTAVITRCVPSSLRVGTFEHFHFTGCRAEVRQLADHVIVTHFGDRAPKSGSERYLWLIAMVSGNLGRMAATMNAVGFVHGALNTDNVSVHGTIIDFGPCDFIEGFDEGLVVNPDDEHGMFAFGKQRDALRTAAQHFADTMAALCGDLATDPVGTKRNVEEAIAAFDDEYEVSFSALMLKKLGLPWHRASRSSLLSRGSVERVVVDATLSLLRKSRAVINYHAFFHAAHCAPATLKPYFDSHGFGSEYREWRAAFRNAAQRLGQQLELIEATLNESSPAAHRTVARIVPYFSAVPTRVVLRKVIAAIDQRERDLRNDTSESLLAHHDFLNELIHWFGEPSAVDMEPTLISQFGRGFTTLGSAASSGAPAVSATPRDEEEDCGCG